MPFNGSKYDLELNFVSYRVKSYQKTEAAPFIPRLGSGEQTESDFDLLKTKTIKGFAGGSLQRYWMDDTSVFASEGLYPIYDDGTLYPVSQAVSGSWAGKSFIHAVAQGVDYAFVASMTFNIPTLSIKRIDKSGTVVNLTLPVNLSNMGAGNYVTDMVVSKTHLWIATGAYGRMYYMPLTSTTVTEVAAGTGGSPQLMVVWKEDLYGTNANPTSRNFLLSKYTGDTVTRSWIQVGRAGTETDSPNSRLLIFNNRIVLSRHDGLFAFDGTASGLNPIDDQTYAPHPNNFRHATPFKGSLIYWMPDGMYRYTGSMIEKLYDISEVGMPVHVNSGKNRLWMIYNNDSWSGSSRYDKSMGYDNSSSNNVDGRLMVFNGKALYTYARTTSWVKNPALEDFSGQGILTHVLWFNDTIRIFTNADKNSQDVFTLSTAEQSNSGSKAWRILTSIFDANFPMIDKTIENLEAVFDGNIAADEDILVEYRLSGFDGSTGWTTLCTLKSQSRIKEQVYNQIPAGLTTKKIQFRFSATTDVRYGIAKLVFRYLLSPDFKWQWNFTVLAYGDSTTQKLMLRDGTDDTQSVRALRGAIYSARQSDVPVIFLDVDQLDQNGTVNISATTIILQDTSLLKDFGFVKIDDEIIYYSAKTSTTLTGCLRGRLGTTAASHTNAAVRPCYRVIVRQIPNERIEMDDGDNNLATNSDRASEIRVLIQEV